LCKTDRRITGVLLDANAGQQCAVFCGLRFSNANYTVIIDDDLEQSPKDILALYGEITKGYDVVYGVSHTAGQKGLFRRFGSALRDRLFDAVTGKPKDKKVCSFRIMNRATVDNVLRAETRFVYISMEILRHTRNIQNITVQYHASAPSGYGLLRLMALLLKIYIYYAPHKILMPLRKKGVCYKIKDIIKDAS
jgi:undecaprenyl-phosphate 4-deoxy-4-formamido-L-arabinose transferase